ncbi:hypothetical protein [Streptomyces sp. NPDC050504]|uniref:hypothetical protein n=1 Tax=Streptomyces sp. NPDC050504 TaxID=3365618 RepID=UPI0037949C79
MKKTLVALAVAAAGMGLTASPALAAASSPLAPTTEAVAVSSPIRGGDGDWCEGCVKKYIKKYKKQLKGDPGKPGKQGKPGKNGKDGKDGVAKPIQIVTGDPIRIEPGQAAGGEVACPAGTTVTGGGYHQDDVVNSYNYISRPNAEGTAWSVSFKNIGQAGDNADTVTPYAMCLPLN